jgi:hypothetical protein
MTESVLRECSHPFDATGWFFHIPKGKRRAASAKRKAEREKLLRAQALRENWTEADFEAEEARIAAQIEEWESRNAP